MSKQMRLQYDRSKLAEAVEMVKGGEMSLRRASEVYFVPYSTLRDRVTGRIDVEARPGVDTVLTLEEEIRLKDYVIACSELGVGKSRDQVRELAYMIIYRDPTRSHHAERWLKNKAAGKDWYYGFMARHSELSLRTPEKLSKNRARMTNQAVLTQFYDILGPYLNEKDPGLIWNCDECGVPLDFRPRKVVASRKARSIWSINSGDKTNITIMGCGAGSGKMMPPMVIYKGKRVNQCLVGNAPDGWMIRFSESGWINSVLFEQWFEFHFMPYVNKYVRPGSPDSTVILLLDGHKSHETLYTLDLASKNNIQIICLPPNTTHVLQPLDVSFFKSLKSKWDRVNEEFCRSNHGQFVTKATFAKVFKMAWDTCVGNPGTVQNGFIRIGLAPFKRMSLQDILKDKDLSPSQCLNRPFQARASTTCSSINSDQTQPLSACLPPIDAEANSESSESQIGEVSDHTDGAANNNNRLQQEVGLVLEISSQTSSCDETQSINTGDMQNQATASAQCNQSQQVQDSLLSSSVSPDQSTEDILEHITYLLSISSGDSNPDRDIIQFPDYVDLDLDDSLPDFSVLTDATQLSDHTYATISSGLSDPTDATRLTDPTDNTRPTRSSDSTDATRPLDRIGKTRLSGSSDSTRLSGLTEDTGLPGSLDPTDDTRSSDLTDNTESSGYLDLIDNTRPSGSQDRTDITTFSASLDPLEDIFTLPTIDTRPPTRKRRRTNPYCRVLTSTEVLEEKRKKENDAKSKQLDAGGNKSTNKQRGRPKRSKGTKPDQGKTKVQAKGRKTKVQAKGRKAKGVKRSATKKRKKTSTVSKQNK